MESHEQNVKNFLNNIETAPKEFIPPHLRPQSPLSIDGSVHSMAGIKGVRKMAWFEDNPNASMGSVIVNEPKYDSFLGNQRQTQTGMY